MSTELEKELERINRLFPDKPKLNKSQMLVCIGKGNKWFETRVNHNRLDELPKFKEPKRIERKGKPYFQYEFNIREIAKFNLI